MVHHAWTIDCHDTSIRVARFQTAVGASQNLRTRQHTGHFHRVHCAAPGRLLLAVLLRRPPTGRRAFVQ